MSENGDEWNPLDDPTGQTAQKSLADSLTANEKRILREFAAGRKIREIEIDRLVYLGLAKRDTSNGEPSLTPLGRDTIRSTEGGPAR